MAVFSVFLVYIAFRLYQTRPRYFYDEKGVYKGSRLLADWNGVAIVMTKFRAVKKDPPAPVTPNFFSAADPTENAEFYPLERVGSFKCFFSSRKSKSCGMPNIQGVTAPPTHRIHCASADFG